MTARDEPIAKGAYDELADSYAEEVRSNPYNADFEFPATTDLIPDVDGKRILDAGCGTGVYSEWLLERGAEVVGVDVSDAMLILTDIDTWITIRATDATEDRKEPDAVR